ncbi:MAG TPA: hypothetical protein VFT99_23675 [Roseiflexaceae bacterium]|nr:hypothetical protein [Roseiflexaceae bacterium]
MNLPRFVALVLLVAVASSSLTVAAQPARQTQTHVAFLPLVVLPPGPPSIFGFDVRDYARNDVLQFAREANPRWVRAGDVLWADVEREPGVYDWSALAGVEANVARLRQLGFEPTIVVQHTPEWAQSVPGRRCSPPRPEYLDAFARFMGALAARYAEGPLAIRYWEVWNEPDFTAGEVQDNQGFGCWANASQPFYGGMYYGEALKRVYPAVKAANPHATVMGGALAYHWPDDTVSRDFLRGMLESGAGYSFDALSFHAYGEWGAGDLLIAKTIRIREILAAYGLADRPLFATEIAATCFSVRSLGYEPQPQGVAPQPSGFTCPPDFAIRQANYAARIYAEASALKLYGALWFSLVAAGPDVIFNAQLIDDNSGNLEPRPSFYAFRNSARLLQDAVYIGPPVREPPPDQLTQVQVLPFRKRGNTLYVFWVPSTDFPLVYNLPVPPGAIAVCTDQLNRETPSTYYCSDTNGDGMIPRAVNELPQYVEVLGIGR